MVRAKREYEGGLVAWHACAAIAFMPFTGKVLDPGKTNPYRERDPEAERKLEEVKRFVARTMLAAHIKEQFRRAGKAV